MVLHTHASPAALWPEEVMQATFYTTICYFEVLLVASGGFSSLGSLRRSPEGHRGAAAWMDAAGISGRIFNLPYSGPGQVRHGPGGEPRAGALEA